MKKYGIDGGGDAEYENEFQVVSSYLCILTLPTDLIYKIFSRLQVKFISRCKLVCRAWYNLIYDPDFMHYYAKHRPFTTLVLSHSHQVVTTATTTITTKRHTFSFVEISEDGDCTRTTIEPKLPLSPKLYSFLSIMGSSNGLLCLLLHNHRVDCEVIYIYNPTSGKSISLPEHRFKSYPMIFKRYYVDTSSYLFGFSPSTNDFKVVKIVRLIDERDNTEHEQQCEIVTVGVDHEWRQLEYTFNVHYPVCRIDLNGALCWFAQKTSSTNIAAFDFAEEKVCQISHPPGVVPNYWTMKLVVLNRRLCLLDYSIPSHYTIWTMEEYGVAESWTKSVILRSCFPSDAPVSHYPIAMLRNGDIVFPLASSKDLMFYSPKQKECTMVDVSDDVEGYIHYIKEFVLHSGRCINKL